MTIRTARLPLAAAMLVGLSGAALAFGGGAGGNSGSGLSPYAALNGNDRSAGVNNGNYRDPALDPYLRTYDPEAAAAYAAPPAAQPRLRLRPYYGQPY
ncbi:hypothetical protein Q8W71_08615 [Methylobacterium sp. NEAU 140]|uniref:hypothetical protein n=1 Tax=Methylobacterium sp. NEAU 140 TaxID=3064945 RepID=UPI002736DFCB|nr:hypothetical protein [Methylobacterium sp. NEAU 140]MDP4022682.1 hypothetical protein [Methylobacterium sp. NEAU 140]